MLIKDKFLLESLTKKYGKRNILNEISNDTIKSAASKAIEKGKYKQAKYFVDNIVDNYENISLTFGKPLFKCKKQVFGFVFNKNKFIGLYEKDGKRECNLYITEEYIDILFDMEDVIRIQVEDDLNMIYGDLYILEVFYETFSDINAVVDDKTISKYIEFLQKIQDTCNKNKITDALEFDIESLIKYKEKIEKVKNIDYEYFEDVLREEIGKRCYNYRGPRYTDMDDPNIAIPAFVATLKEFNIDCTYKLMKNERETIGGGHRGQWADNRSNVEFALIVNGKNIIITIGGGGGGPLSYSGLYYNEEKLAFAETWYVGWQLKFKDAVLKKLVDDIKKAKNNKNRTRNSKK
jgi:hypothetical protein